MTLGTTVRCPNIVKNYFGDNTPCNYQGYIIIDPQPFNKDSGLDYLGIKVKCRKCQHEFFVMPSPSFKE